MLETVENDHSGGKNLIGAPRRLQTPNGHHLGRGPGCNGSVEYGTNGEGV